MLTSILRKLSVGALCCGVVLSLTGCVSGSADTTFKTDNGSISIAFSDPVTSATVTNISMSNAAKVTATVRDPVGNLVPNAVVSFTTSATLATMIPASGTALTNAFGVASIQIIGASPTAAGAATISATTSVAGATLAVSGGFGVIATNTGATGINMALANPVSGATVTNISTGNPAKVSVTVRDTSGAVVPNTVVTFVTEASLASMIPATGTALTDASGVASIQINAASPTAAGAATITATALVGGAALSARTGFGVIPTSTGVTGTIQIDTLAFNSIQTGDLLKVNASVSDATGKGVPNTVVTFTTAASLITMFPGSGGAVTDSSGRASIQIAAANPTAAGAATISATATVNGTSVSGSVNLNVIATKTAAGVTVALTNPTSGATVTNISPGSPAKVTATIRNAAGSGVPNTVVTFSTNSALAVMTPLIGTALTDSLGVATIQIDAASLTAAGATTITATTSVENATVSGGMGFSVSAANAALANMQVKTNPLSPYATTSVSVDVTGVPANTPVTINFSSICAGTGKATLPASVQTSNGTATATYTDKGCASLDTVTASVAGLAITKTITLQVTSPGAASIQFVSANPSTIVLKGTGGAGLVESSLVRFRVVDTNNLPVSPAVNVTFDLTTRAGDILLDGSTAAVTKLTDANGEASVTVQSGTAPTAVWVTARMSDTLLTQSNQLRISTGRPSQDRFSIAASVPNIDGLTVNGVTTTITAIASDRLGNPVPDGTAINFISGGAQIEPSCATTNGTCKVTFTSANPRPANGRVAVIAYSLGEESFVDDNGNNKYDDGEKFNDLGDVFIDNNGDNVWDPGEQSISFKAGNSSACVSGDSTSPSAPSKGLTCDGKWGAAHVRQSAQIVLSGNAPATPSLTTVAMSGGCSQQVSINLKDALGNAMPAGTKLTVDSNSVYDNSAPNKLNATINVTPDTVQNSIAGTSHTISVLVPACIPTVSGSFNLNVATPAATSNTKTAIQFTVTP